MKVKKIAVLYRVVQDWRAPVFERLAEQYGFDNIKIFHGPDFKDSKVISTKNKYNFKSIKVFSFKLRFQGSYSKGYMPFSPFLFFKLIYFNPNVIISEGASNFLNAVQGYAYCKLFRKKFIWWSLGKLVHIPTSNKRSFFNKIIQYIERNSHSIITYSNQGKNYFESIGVLKRNIFVAVNVVDTDNRKSLIRKYSSLVEKNNENLSVVYAGAILKSKKLNILIDAIDILTKRGVKSIQLNIIGDGPDRECFEVQVQNQLLQDKIFFLGKKGDDISKFFLENDLLIMPGLGGLVISDAMVHGLAVITSHGDGCEKDLVVDGKNGYFIDDMTPENLAEKIYYLYLNRNLLDQFKIESKRIIDKEYNINKYMSEIYNAIES